MGRKTHTCDMPYLRMDGPDGVEHAGSAHHGTVALDAVARQEIARQLDEAIGAESALTEHVQAQLTKKIAQLKTREDGLFALIGHPEWDQNKLNKQMRDLRKDKTATARQLADMGTALDTGRQVFLTALAMLDRPRDTYDHGDDAIKITLAKTIFGRLHLNATPTGTVNTTTTAPAEPFADLLAAAHGHHATART